MATNPTAVVCWYFNANGEHMPLNENGGVTCQYCGTDLGVGKPPPEPPTPPVPDAAPSAAQQQAATAAAYNAGYLAGLKDAQAALTLPAPAPVSTPDTSAPPAPPADPNAPVN